MKKPILYTLLAVLLVCFLSACVSDPPEPTPPPSTTAGDTAGGSTEPSSDETTTEPIEITSDEPMETADEITTEELTSESPETTEEDIVCESEMHFGAWVFHMNPLTTLDGNFGNITDPVEVADTETPWYITEWETQTAIETPAVPEEKKNLAFRVPLVYEGICNKMQVKLEFFQEYYLVGEPIQVRITIENRGTSSTTYDSAPYRYPITIQKGGSWEEAKYDPFGKLSTAYFEQGDIGTDHPYWRALYEYAEDSARGLTIRPKGDFSENPSSSFSTFFDGTAVLEYILTYDPSAVSAADTYEVEFMWYSSFYWQGAQYRYRLSVPMEIVEVTLVPAE